MTSTPGSKNFMVYFIIDFKSLFDWVALPPSWSSWSKSPAVQRRVSQLRIFSTKSLGALYCQKFKNINIANEKLLNFSIFCKVRLVRFFSHLYLVYIFREIRNVSYQKKKKNGKLLSFHVFFQWMTQLFFFLVWRRFPEFSGIANKVPSISFVLTH